MEENRTEASRICHMASADFEKEAATNTFDRNAKMKKLLLYASVGLGLVSASASAARGADAPESWKDSVVEPVVNPIFFESPFIRSQVEPLFIYNKIANDFIGGEAYVYGLQLRYAVNDRLALIATKDGVVDLNSNVGALNDVGFADISVGLKYALIDNEDRQFILTPGLEIELPSGNETVFQGNGMGEWDLFLAAAKGWGRFHTMANVGLRIPNDMSAETAQAHYSLQVDYDVCRWFRPFATLNAFTVLNSAHGPAFGFEGYDLINFGSSQAAGETRVVVGGGASSQVMDSLQVGVAYESGIDNPKFLFDHRVTATAVFEF